MFEISSFASSLKILAVVAATLVSACSSTSQTATTAVDPAKVQITAALTQRPSEINIPVKGKVTRTGEIYLLRGLANVFSRGMDTLGAKMVRKGLDARVYNHAAWRELADNILLRAKKRQVSYPIVIMGHSLGANASANMAAYLGRRGVKVSYVVTFDPTVPTRVGKNVGRVVNFYLPKEDNTNAVRKGAGFKGILKNIDVRGVRGITHTNVEKDAKFHGEVIRRTLGYTKAKRKNRG